jgi:hypothetical protein
MGSDFNRRPSMTNPIKTIHWNTGRKYTAAGQRMTASLYSDGLVVYVDIDRNITGHYYLDSTLLGIPRAFTLTFSTSGVSLTVSELNLRSITMQRYDNHYKEDWPGDESWAIIRDRYDETERAAWANDWAPEVA